MMAAEEVFYFAIDFKIFESSSNIIYMVSI